MRKRIPIGIFGFRGAGGTLLCFAALWAVGRAFGADLRFFATKTIYEAAPDRASAGAKRECPPQ